MRPQELLDANTWACTSSLMLDIKQAGTFQLQLAGNFESFRKKVLEHACIPAIEKGS